MGKNRAKSNRKFKVLILLFIILGILNLNKNFRNKFFYFIKSEKTLKTINQTPILVNNDDINIYDNTLVRWDGENILGLNIRNNQKWQKKIKLESPNVFLGSKNIYLSQQSTGTVYKLDVKGNTKFKYKCEGNIKSLKEKNGNAILVLKNDGKNVINILNDKGSMFCSIPIENEHLLDFSVNEDESSFIISTLTLSNKDVCSNLKFCKKNGQVLSNLHFKNEIITLVEFIDKNRLIALTDKNLFFIKNNKILWKKELSNIKDIFLNKEKEIIEILYDNNLETISYNGRTKRKKTLNDNYTKILSYDKNILLISDKQILGLNNGKQFLKYKSKQEIEKVLSNKYNIVILTQNKINIMDIVNKK